MKLSDLITTRRKTFGWTLQDLVDRARACGHSKTTRGTFSQITSTSRKHGQLTTKSTMDIVAAGLGLDPQIVGFASLVQLGAVREGSPVDRLVDWWAYSHVIVEPDAAMSTVDLLIPYDDCTPSEVDDLRRLLHQTVLREEQRQRAGHGWPAPRVPSAQEGAPTAPLFSSAS